MALVKWNLAAPHGVRYVNEWRGDCTLEFEEGREEEIFQDIVGQLNMHLQRMQYQKAGAVNRAAAAKQPLQNKGGVGPQAQSVTPELSRVVPGLPKLKIDDEGNVTTEQNPGTPGGQTNGG